MRVDVSEDADGSAAAEDHFDAPGRGAWSFYVGMGQSNFHEPGALRDLFRPAPLLPAPPIEVFRLQAARLRELARRLAAGPPLLQQGPAFHFRVSSLSRHDRPLHENAGAPEHPAGKGFTVVQLEGPRRRGGTTIATDDAAVED